MSQDTPSKFSAITVALHWLVGIGVIVLIAFGIYMEENKAYHLYDLHKSFGILVLIFALWRVVNRVANGWPSAVVEMKSWEQMLARAVHWLLIIGTILMPISGMMMSGMGGHGVELFGLELIAAQPDPNNPRAYLPINEGLAELAETLHGIGGNCLIAAIVLHIAAALKHHFIVKDGTLSRMLGKRI